MHHQVVELLIVYNVMYIMMYILNFSYKGKYGCKLHIKLTYIYIRSQPDPPLDGSDCSPVELGPTSLSIGTKRSVPVLLQTS